MTRLSLISEEKMAKKRLSVMLTKDEYEAICKIANDEHKNYSLVIRELILTERYLDIDYEKKELYGQQSAV